MLKTINLTTQEEDALNDVYNRIMDFASKSPRTADILDITTIKQERIMQVLDRIHHAKAYDGRNIHILPSNLRPAHESSAADHTPSTDATPSAAHGDH